MLHLTNDYVRENQKKFSHKWVVMKIESQMDVVMLNFPEKLLGISWL